MENSPENAEKLYKCGDMERRIINPLLTRNGEED